MRRIEFFKHSLGKAEERSLCKALKSPILTTGKYTKRFEKIFSAHIGLPYTVGLTSCTAALQLGLQGCTDFETNSGEIITTPLTFVATSLAIIHAGYTPVFVDVEPTTGNIDVKNIEKAITKKTRGILPVHLYGQMCDMKKLSKISTKRDLWVIEDAAHALESERDGVRPGQLSAGACFSFYATKSITSGEGGAFSTDDSILCLDIRMMRSHGMTNIAADRYKHYEHWDLAGFGWKYNMDNLQAALLLPQIYRIESLWKKRKKLFEYYLEELSSCKNIRFPKILKNSKHGYHLFTIWVDPKNRDTILNKLQEVGVAVTVNYRAIHLSSAFKNVYRYERGNFPNAELIGDSTISLPLYPKLSYSDAKYVVKMVKKVVG